MVDNYVCCKIYVLHLQHLYNQEDPPIFSFLFFSQFHHRVQYNHPSYPMLHIGHGGPQDSCSTSPPPLQPKGSSGILVLVCVPSHILLHDPHGPQLLHITLTFLQDLCSTSPPPLQPKRILRYSHSCFFPVPPQGHYNHSNQSTYTFGIGHGSVLQDFVCISLTNTGQGLLGHACFFISIVRVLLPIPPPQGPVQSLHDPQVY